MADEESDQEETTEIQPEKPPSKAQSQDIFENRDIEFEVDGKTVGASKSFLCMLSPVFKVMLKGSFMESGLTKIPLLGKSYDDFVEFIEVTHLSKSVTIENVYSILPIIHEYGCRTLLERCEEVLLEEEASLHHYFLATSYGLQKLYDTCIPKLARMNFSTLRKEEKCYYNRMEESAKLDYLEASLKLAHGILKKESKILSAGTLHCPHCSAHNKINLECTNCKLLKFGEICKLHQSLNMTKLAQ